MDSYLAPATLTNIDIIGSVGDLSLSDAGHSHSHSCTILAVGDSDSDTSPLIRQDY